MAARSTLELFFRYINFFPKSSYQSQKSKFAAADSAPRMRRSVAKIEIYRFNVPNKFKIRNGIWNLAAAGTAPSWVPACDGSCVFWNGAEVCRTECSKKVPRQLVGGSVARSRGGDCSNNAPHVWGSRFHSWDSAGPTGQIHLKGLMWAPRQHPGSQTASWEADCSDFSRLC